LEHRIESIAEMPRVVPSQVVMVIDKLFPYIRNRRPRGINQEDRAAVMTVVDLVAQIPHELLPRDIQGYCDLTMGLNTLHTAVTRWATSEFTIGGAFSYSTTHPIELIRDVLVDCPDTAPTPTTVELLFLTDPKFREELRTDISSAYHAIANGEWKAATVLAGSVVEALLLWRIQQYQEADYQKALNDVVAKNIARRPRYAPLEQWDLVHYIAVAEELQTINADTASQTRLAKNFRNLIHPGKAQREAQTCTRGTALAALAAVEMVVECLT
jgi:hypothetical protein